MILVFCGITRISSSLCYQCLRLTNKIYLKKEGKITWKSTSVSIPALEINGATTTGAIDFARKLASSTAEISADAASLSLGELGLPRGWSRKWECNIHFAALSLVLQSPSRIIKRTVRECRTSGKEAIDLSLSPFGA